MTTLNKIKWILGIAMIFVLVLTTNLIDRQNFNIVSESLETIYADRLVAQNIIYELTNQIGKKEIAYVTTPPAGLVENVKLRNDRIKESIDLFAQTKLTPKEEIVFNRLRSSLNKLREVEKNVAANLQENGSLQPSLHEVRRHLDGLSAIQLQEGRRELFESKKAISAANLFTQLEIAALVIMAIVIQVIIIYTPKENFEG